MKPTDLTLEILKGIRDEGRQTNVKLGELRDELRGEMNGLRGEMNGLRGEVTGLRGEVNGLRAELHSSIERVERRMTETEVRLATEVVALGATLRDVRDLLQADFALRHRVDDHEQRLSAMERRGQ